VNVALGLVRSTALYLFLSLLVSLFAFGVGFSKVSDALTNPADFEEWFLASGVWALPVFLFTVALGVVSLVIQQRLFKRLLFLGIGEHLTGVLFYAFKNPYHGLILVWFKRDPALTPGQRAMSQSYSLFHFIWTVTLIAFIAAGLVAVSR
jgi:hypothetical protein